MISRTFSNTVLALIVFIWVVPFIALVTTSLRSEIASKTSGFWTAFTPTELGHRFSTHDKGLNVELIELKGNINSGKIFDISDKNVALIIKKYTALSGLNKDMYSGHSLRSGFATSTAESGAEERSIMSMTGHKTTQMVRRYIQEANLFKNNALNKLKV